MTSEHQSRAQRRLTATVTDLEVAVQRAFLVGVQLPGTTTTEEERSLVELALLTDTAGADPVDQEVVKRDRIDPATFIGSGKAEELATLTTALDIDVVIFDQALSPAQQRNLQAIFHCDVVDREALILDIFAQHATSNVGAIQVELALLKYNLPRLRGKGSEMAQQRAGVGTTMRGPGETKLETDRRRVLQRISKLEKQLKATEGHRETQRKQRRRTQIPQVALVGYTNAGKSTLLNALTGAGAGVGESLFHTLDPTTRAFRHNGHRYLVTDTVGFIRKLPHQLVEAFKATLEETALADLIVHVIDAAEPEETRAESIAAVDEVLEEIGAGGTPRVLALNKIDLLEADAARQLAIGEPDSVAISALTGEGLDELRDRIETAFEQTLRAVELLVPYEAGDRLSELHEIAGDLHREERPDGVLVRARVPAALEHRFAQFAANGRRDGSVEA